MNRSCDIVVIGGGLVGSAISWGALRMGASVCMLDEGDVAFRAARGNFGLVWVQGKGAGAPPYTAWSRLSQSLWGQLAALLMEETGIDVGLRVPGGLAFCLTEAEFRTRANLVAKVREESGDDGTCMIDASELRRMVPQIGDAVVGASFNPRDGAVNPLQLLRAFHKALHEARAFRPENPVTSIERDGMGFRIRHVNGVCHAGKVVIAAGLGGAGLAPLVGLALPVTPVRGQIMVTERCAPFLQYTTHILRQTLEGSVLIGDSRELVDFDDGVTVDAQAAMARRALATFPLLKDRNVVRFWGALRIMTPDGRPIYEQSPSMPGAFTATCHSGVSLAAAHALVLAPSIMAGAIPAQLSSFHSERFDVPKN